MSRLGRRRRRRLPCTLTPCTSIPRRAPSLWHARTRRSTGAANVRRGRVGPRRCASRRRPVLRSVPWRMRVRYMYRAHASTKTCRATCVSRAARASRRVCRRCAPPSPTPRRRPRPRRMRPRRMRPAPPSTTCLACGAACTMRPRRAVRASRATAWPVRRPSRQWARAGKTRPCRSTTRSPRSAGSSGTRSCRRRAWAMQSSPRSSRRCLSTRSMSRASTSTRPTPPCRSPMMRRGCHCLTRATTRHAPATHHSSRC